MTEIKTRATVAGEAKVIQKIASDRMKAEERIHKIEREPEVSSEISQCPEGNSCYVQWKCQAMH